MDAVCDHSFEAVDRLGHTPWPKIQWSIECFGALGGVGRPWLALPVVSVVGVRRRRSTSVTCGCLRIAATMLAVHMVVEIAIVNVDLRCVKVVHRSCRQNSARINVIERKCPSSSLACTACGVPMSM